MADLREKTNGSRTTLRIDIPKYNCAVERVVAESTAPGIPSARKYFVESASSQDLPVDRKDGEVLIQGDTINAEIPPPAPLLAVYQVKAQMLIPLVSGKDTCGWISIHYVPSTRVWTKEEVFDLRTAAQTVCSILKENGWAVLTVN